MCQAMNLDILRVLGIKPPKVPKARDPNAVEVELPDPVTIQVCLVSGVLPFIHACA